MPNLLKKRHLAWGGVICAALLTLHLLGYFSSGTSHAPSPEQTSGSSSASSASPLSQASPSAAAAADPHQIRFQYAMASTSETEILRCVPGSSTHFFDQLEARFGKRESVEVLVQNTHLKNQNGIERRIQQLSSPDDKGIKLRMFTVDAEGLPEPVLIPNMQARNPSPDYLKGLFAMGEVTFVQEKIEQHFEDATVTFTRENGFTTELHLQSGLISLGCAAGEETETTDCRCISESH